MKSGNAVVLRGSLTAVHSNAVLAPVVSEAADRRACPRTPSPPSIGGDRAEVAELVTSTALVDVIIPRGGGGLNDASSRMRQCRSSRRAWATATSTSTRADLEKTMPIVINAKCQRPGVCNAIETLLVDVRSPPAASGAARSGSARPGVESLVDGRTRAPRVRTGRGLVARHRGGLGHRVPGDADLGEGGWKPGRGHRSHQSYGTGHSEAIVTEDSAAAYTSSARSTPRRLRECLHPLHRWRRVRPGRRDRRLDTEAACARADRAARADDLQVGGARRRPGARVTAAKRFPLRVGVFGGAFNPPHVGHLILAGEALWQLGAGPASC